VRVVDDPEEEILLITQQGMVLRTTVGSISRIGRQTQGVIVMRVPEGDAVTALARVGLSLEELEVTVPPATAPVDGSDA
jgi:DNA gyrase subunit A